MSIIYKGVEVGVTLGGGGAGGIPLMSAADWAALSIAQKRNYGLVAVQSSDTGYDRGELYYGGDASADNPAIPAMTSNTTPSGVVSYSSQFGANYAGYMAFNGTQGNISMITNCWLAASSDTAPYLAYEFANPKNLYSLWLELMNNSTAYTVTAYIEGKTSGGTWENCLESGASVSLEFPRSTIKTYTIALNERNYTAIRIRGVESWYKGAGLTACGISRMQAYSD